MKWAVDPVADIATTAGDILYATAADTLTRLGIGTAGQVLKVNSGATAPEWAAASAGGADWSLLNAGGTTLTGAQTVTVSGISGKDKIMVLVDGASSASASSLISVRLNTDTGTNYYLYGAEFYWPSTYSAANYKNLTPVDNTGIRLAFMSNSASSVVTGYVLLSGCNSSGVKIFNSAAGASAASNNEQANFILGGYYNSSSTISSVSVFSGTGNLDAGTVYVYTSA